MANYSRFRMSSKIPSIGGLGEASAMITLPEVALSSSSDTRTVDITVPNGAIASWTMHIKNSGYDAIIVGNSFLDERTSENGTSVTWYLLQRTSATTYRFTARRESQLTYSETFPATTITVTGRFYNVS